MAAVDTLHEGRVAEAADQLKDEIRRNPADAKHRIFYFQLLCIQGDWDRALTQLNVVGDLDAGALAMVQTYQEALRCEALRAEVFAAKRTPMLFGQPDQWLALLIEALLVSGQGNAEAAANLRAQAFDAAPTTSGSMDGAEFAWLADADTRLGPVLEAIVNGKYYWIPFDRLLSVHFDPPEDLRDLVWLPAHLTFSNGGESVALIPSRYPGSEKSADPAILMARKTEWLDDGAGGYHGMGQRLLTTDQGDKSLLEIRQLDFVLNADEDASSSTPDDG